MDGHFIRLTKEQNQGMVEDLLAKSFSNASKDFFKELLRDLNDFDYVDVLDSDLKLYEALGTSRKTIFF
jgi:hypothetical protein